MIQIRDETTGDHERIRRVTIDAFAASEFGHNGEADLVDALRLNSGNYLSLVAQSDDDVVGHVLFTPVVVRSPQAESRGMGLGPMSVNRHFQKTGIGSSLVTAGLNRLFTSGCPFVVVLGHPEYYSRFGFRPATRHRIYHGFPGIPQSVFFIRMGPDGTLAVLSDGLAYYREEFGAQHTGT